MTKKKCFILTIIMLLFVATSQAQDEETGDSNKLKRFEVGGHFIYLRRTDAHTVTEFLSNNNSSYEPNKINELGIGVRFTYNFTKYAAVEIEGNLFPEDKKADFIVGVPIEVFEPGGRKMQALAGPKIGYRGDKFGIFGKARVGLIRLDRYAVIVDAGEPPNPYVISEIWNKTGFFNTDIGGVFEYYPSKNTVFRVDVSDSIIHYHKFPPKEINPSMTRHNLQTSFGFGFRF